MPSPTPRSSVPVTIVVGKTATAYEVLSRALADLGAVEAAIIMALLDVVGRHAKAPVYRSWVDPRGTRSVP